MIIEFNALIQSAKVINDLVKAAKELRNYNEVTTATAELNCKILEAQVVAFACLEKCSFLDKRAAELEKEIMELKKWDAEAKRYYLKEITPGFFAYILKPAMELGDPPHELCANCFTQGKKAILQRDRFLEYVCPRCKTTIRPI